MRSESAMWRKLRPILIAAKLDPVRVENPIHPGTPDVNIATGHWIELKCIASWPQRASTKVRIPHYTPQQRVWLYRRWTFAPGSTLLLLEVRSDRQWLLFDGDVAAKIVARGTAADHRAGARVVLDERELSELPKIFAEVRGQVQPALTQALEQPVQTPEQSALTSTVCTGSFVHDEFTCTGSLVHNEFTYCPVHDARVVR